MNNNKNLNKIVNKYCDNIFYMPFQISFDVTVTASSCFKDKSFTIRALGIKDTLTVTLSTNCECDCKDSSDTSHPHCKSKGKVTCGICR